MTRLDFEQTLAHLQGWLGELVAVTVSPAFDGSVQTAILGGTLARTVEPPAEIKAVVGAAGADEILFFFVEREEGDRRDAFCLAKAFFDYSFTQPSSTGGEMLVIMLRGVFVSVRPMS